MEKEITLDSEAYFGKWVRTFYETVYKILESQEVSKCGYPQWLPAVVAEPALSPHLKQLSLKAPKLNNTDSAGLGSTEKAFGGNPAPRSSHSEKLHHRKEEKIMKFSTFQLTIPLHPGGTGQGLWLCSYFYPQISGMVTTLGFRTPQSTPLHPMQS